jgi:hypothetical protein
MSIEWDIDMYKASVPNKPTAAAKDLQNSQHYLPQTVTSHSPTDNTCLKPFHSVSTYCYTDFLIPVVLL